jgi:ABC-type Mn2+/Zn2+ transport system permease subunit
MTMNEAIALQPTWVYWWLNWMLIGAFALPLVLLIWRPSRRAGIYSLVAGILAAVATGLLYDQLGYVKLLGLPHVLFWTPLALYLFAQLKRTDMPDWPIRIMMIILATIVISLAFDYVGVIQYAFGARTPFPGAI